VLATNAFEYAKSANRRLAASAEIVCGSAFLAVGAKQPHRDAIKHVGQCVAAAILRPRRSPVWDDAAWAPGGDIVPAFHRDAKPHERAAFMLLAEWARWVRRDLEVEVRWEGAAAGRRLGRGLRAHALPLRAATTSHLR
jgi:hypothetical protein